MVKSGESRRKGLRVGKVGGKAGGESGRERLKVGKVGREG